MIKSVNLYNSNSNFKIFNKKQFNSSTYEQRPLCSSIASLNSRNLLLSFKGENAQLSEVDISKRDDIEKNEYPPSSEKQYVFNGTKSLKSWIGRRAFIQTVDNRVCRASKDNSNLVLLKNSLYSLETVNDDTTKTDFGTCENASRGAILDLAKDGVFYKLDKVVFSYSAKKEDENTIYTFKNKKGQTIKARHDNCGHLTQAFLYDDNQQPIKGASQIEGNMYAIYDIKDGKNTDFQIGTLNEEQRFKYGQPFDEFYEFKAVLFNSNSDIKAIPFL